MIDISINFSQNSAGSIKDEKLIYPAANRNKEPILQVLKRFMTPHEDCTEEKNPLFLEIASGSGQHVFHFAPHFPTIKFQPTEVDHSLLGSINYYAKNCPTRNILPPILVDICNRLNRYGLKENSIDYLYCANMIHISPYVCTIGLFENAGLYLKHDALMITYGPYSKDGIIVPESNVEFDLSLRTRNPLWGLRDINDLKKVGEKNNLTLIDTVEMPANNKTLIWKKN
ncbi:hypothetical protein K1T71_001857 [Dendrolimus kikuchii]|uniref:Uncharacterized protein n=1 Tax=Dendrolimus kikuchii TaxID=765133 RepID=A0ACC1DFR0_9NEOP|nr:hypothetical protein K1T71_001857 [Dendrolimus kikuchii]